MWALNTMCVEDVVLNNLALALSKGSILTESSFTRCSEISLALNPLVPEETIDRKGLESQAF
jgi:hypothetical protein